MPVIFLILFSFVLSDDWKLVKKNEQFKVFVRKPDGNAYEQIKIIAQTTASMSEVVAALEDVDHHKDWVYATGESYILETRSYDDFDYYVTVKMPFPIKDRDLTIHLRREVHPSGIVKILSKSKTNIKDHVDGKVRISDFESHYILSPMDDGLIEIEYFLNVDPAGTLPAWVVNLVTTKGPTETMNSLLELLDSGHYKDAFVEGL